MGVDVHTHTPNRRAPISGDETQTDAFFRPDQETSAWDTWEDHLTAMEAVDRVVFDIAFDSGGRTVSDNPLIYAPLQVNDDTAAFGHAYPDKLIGILTVY